MSDQTTSAARESTLSWETLEPWTRQQVQD